MRLDIETPINANVGIKLEFNTLQAVTQPLLTELILKEPNAAINKWVNFVLSDREFLA